MSFIPLIINSNNLISTEASLKYFLTQVFASIILLFSIILFIITKNFNFQIELNINYYLILIFITLIIKSGIAPFHFWFPNVIEGLSWYNRILLITWQKIAPIVIITYFIIFNFFIIFIIISVIVGAIGGLNQSSLRKILAFSSINHLGWILTAIIFNEYTWLFYFLIYSLILLRLIFIFNIFKLFYLNQVFRIFSYSSMLKFTLITSLLSLSGLPPFLGFIPKWIIIQSLMKINAFFLIIIIIIISLITIYFYLRISYSSFILNYFEQNWNYSIFINKTEIIITTILLILSLFRLIVFLNLIYIFY